VEHLCFFCNYARPDGFDPTLSQVPLKDRPDIDRWILSDLQKLVALAHKSFQTFNAMAFCLEAERFVDDKLSNWYVRRNRRRFWKSEKGDDKDAAYQTLYEVLLTLTKLFAPVMPFLAETMYHNLVPGAQERGDSVHLCPYPEVNEALRDDTLSADMDALLDLVSLGSAARNTVKIKVRQPLAELKVQTSQESVRRAVERFGDQLCDELNIARVTFLSNKEFGALVKTNYTADAKISVQRMGRTWERSTKRFRLWRLLGRIRGGVGHGDRREQLPLGPGRED